MSWLRFFIAFLLFLTFYFAPEFTLAAQAPLANEAGSNDQVTTRSTAEIFYLNKVNHLRQNKGLSPLLIDRRLSESAKNKNADMINNNYWGHFANNGYSYYQFIWAKSPKAASVGENLAKCYTDRQTAFNALVNSPEHYKIMTGNFTDFGVSESFDFKNNCIYTTMHFSLYSQ